MTMRTAIDLFAGAGGLALGLRAAGFELRAAVELDSAAALTYRKNIGEHVIQKSIRDVSADEVVTVASVGVGDCDLLAAGPPCQGFSYQRDRESALNDPRNSLVLDVVRLVNQLRPKTFLIENVPGFASRRGSALLSEVTTLLRETYAVYVTELNAVEFGVAQSRSRLFVVGQRLDLRLPALRFPIGAPAKTWRTVRDAIADLPSPPLDGSPHPLVPNHFREARLSATNRERLSHIPPGGGRESLPLHLQLPCHRDNPSHRHLDVYGRLEWERPSVTITARFDSFTRGRFAHPAEDRSLTLREGARLQSFPDSFVFFGNREQCASQIGNAVPPLLAERVGRCILQSLDGLPAENTHTNTEAPALALV